MSRTKWGWLLPVLVTGAAAVIGFFALPEGSVRWGILLGLGIALVQSMASIAALKAVWNTKKFYWVWGGGMFARLLVFAVTAVVVHHSAHFNFAATLLTLAVATMVLLVSESLVFFSK